MTETRESLLERCGDVTRRDRRNLVRVLASFAIWAVAFVAVSQLIKREILGGPLSWLAALLPVALGVLVLATYARFLRQTDELQRLILLEALALAAGGTFFAVCCYQVFERLGAPQADLSHAIVAMGLLYAVGTAIGQWRYR